MKFRSHALGKYIKLRVTCKEKRPDMEMKDLGCDFAAPVHLIGNGSEDSNILESIIPLQDTENTIL